MTGSDVKSGAAIVIVNYNGAGFIEPTIRSALAQRPAAEVIVVDNASTDGSLAVLARIPGIRVIESAVNLGFAGGANLGASVTSAVAIAFLNSDAVAKADWLALMLPWMSANGIDLASSVVACGSGTFFAGGRWIPLLGSSLTAVRTRPSTAWLSGCALVVTRSAWDRLGGFDAGFFLYFEDVDLSLRARAAGLRLGIYPRALVNHDEPGKSAASLGPKKLPIVYRAKGRLIAKHVPWPARLCALAFNATISPGLAAGPRGVPIAARALVSGARSGRSKTSRPAVNRS